MVQMQVIFIVTLWCMAQQIVALPTIPKPEVARCSKNQEDMNLPHESNCKQYYRCVYSRKVPKLCPERMVFNKDIGNCDFSYNVVNCLEKYENKNPIYKEVIEEMTGQTKEVNSDSTIDSSNSTTVLEERFVYLPHENDSNAYYKFENGKKLLRKCRENQQFDFNLEVCVNISTNLIKEVII